jgi:hypothetical protein
LNNRNKNFGLPGIFNGTTESEAELMAQARAEVAKKLGVSSLAKPTMPAPIDQDLDPYYVEPISVQKPTEVKDKFGNTPAQKTKMINDWLTRPANPYAAARKQAANNQVERLKPPTETEKEATAFWKAYNDPSGKKMVSYVQDMNKKYNTPDAEAAQTKHDKPLAVLRQKMNETKDKKTTVKAVPEKKKLLNYNIGKGDFEYI